MSKYSDKKRAKVLGTYVPPYDRSERVKSKYSEPERPKSLGSDFSEADYWSEYDRFVRSRDANSSRHFT